MYTTKNGGLKKSEEAKAPIEGAGEKKEKTEKLGAADNQTAAGRFGRERNSTALSRHQKPAPPPRHRHYPIPCSPAPILRHPVQH